MKDLWKFIKSSGVYFVGTVLTKLISFLLLPMYTSYISPQDYGVYDLYNAYVMFLCSVLFLDIWAGIMRFMFDYSGEERKKPISSGIAIFLISCSLYTVIVVVAGPMLHIKYLGWLFLYGILMNTQTLVGYIARGYGKNVLYTGAGLLGSVTTIAFNIILLVYFKMDFSALFIASCIGFIANILCILIGIKEPKVFSLRNFDKKVFKEILIFSLPLCLNSVAYWFLTSYNRIVVANQLGDAANGYYAIAGRFGSMITLFTTCFQMAWQELAYSKSAKENDLNDFYTVATNSYVKTMGAGLIVLIPVIYIIYPIMINNSYDVGKELVPVYLLGTIFSTISSFLGNSISAIKKNKLLFWTMLSGSVVNVVVVHTLTPVIGLQASNISLMLGFLTICITRIIVLRKEVELKLEYRNVLILVAGFAVVEYIYQNGDIWKNILAFVIAIAVSVYVFWDIIIVMKDKLLDARNDRLQRMGK